ncbi:MAG: hypothetical protein H7Z40_22775 [Phycisphaerae bacterium]|nr:hypothetical protein [Gemmatimonadaceae bacterium]
MALVSTILAACGSDGTIPDAGRGEAQITLHASQPPASSNIVGVTVRNTGTVPLEMGGCPTALEQRAGANWVFAGSNPNGCDRSLRVIGVGQSIELVASPWVQTSGTYRFRYDSLRDGGSLDASSQLPLANRVSTAFALVCVPSVAGTCSVNFNP